MPGKQIITIASVALNSKVSLPRVRCSTREIAGNAKLRAFSHEMNTMATSAAAAISAARSVSLSLSEDVTVVPSSAARAVIASRG